MHILCSLVDFYVDCGKFVSRVIEYMQVPFIETQHSIY